MKIIDGYMARKNSSPFLWFSKECVWYALTLSDSCLAGCCTSIVYLILVLLSLSGPGFFGVPGPGVGRGEGGMRAVYNSKNIHGIEMKFFGVRENHKLINLA